MTVLATPLQTEYQRTASSLNSYCIVWRCALGHCSVVGGNWLQSNAVHRVWHGVAKWSDSLPYSKFKSPTLPAPKQPQTITLLPPCFRHSSSIFSLFRRLKNVLLCDPNTSNLDLSVHNTFFQSSSIQCLCYFAHLNIFLLLASLRYGLFFATLPRRPASRSRLFIVDVETGVLRIPFNEAAS